MCVHVYREPEHQNQMNTEFRGEKKYFVYDNSAYSEDKCGMSISVKQMTFHKYS